MDIMTPYMWSRWMMIDLRALGCRVGIKAAERNGRHFWSARSIETRLKTKRRRINHDKLCSVMESIICCDICVWLML